MTTGRVEAPGGVVVEDDHWIVDHAISPTGDRFGRPFARGWLIVRPKRHVESVAELSPDEAASLGPLLQRVSAAAERALRAERVYVCSFGEEVRHVHFHVVPRTPEMPPKGPLLLPELFSEDRPWGCSNEEAAEAAAAVRGALAS